MHPRLQRSQPPLQQGLIVKLRPAGPWRSGPDSGARNRVDPVYHSDSLYGAVTAAMSTLGLRDAWLDATARRAEGSAVRFSSCFPFQGETAFIVPPRSIWPPAAGVGASVSAVKTRWKAARFIPLPLVEALLGGQPLHENPWTVDGASECLLPAGQPGPFRANVRWSAAIDRLTGNAERHSTACIEFRRDAGLWAIVAFADAAAHASWSEPVRGAFRLQADSGFGGERSRGWGRSAQPEFIAGTLPALVLGESPAYPAAPEPTPEPVETASEPDSPPRTAAVSPAPDVPDPDAAFTSHWLLSLFTPGPDDAVDWKRGNYTVIARGGRIDSPAGFGDRKKQLQMVTEGSVLVAGDTIDGAAPDVAPEGFAHPVFRAGFALSIPLPRPNRDREGAA
jgi:CRISPR type III-A-associated RAMP protein Csm4